MKRCHTDILRVQQELCRPLQRLTVERLGQIVKRVRHGPTDELDVARIHVQRLRLETANSPAQGRHDDLLQIAEHLHGMERGKRADGKGVIALVILLCLAAAINNGHLYSSSVSHCRR